MDGKAEAVYSGLIETVELLKKQNKTLFSKLAKSNLQILRLLIKIVEQIDPYTKGHSLKVYRHVIKMAKRLNLDKEDIAIIGKAALLHDIGKIAIDKRILNKKGKLTKEELDMVRAHPSIGAQIIEKIECLKANCPHILYHHARFNGGGYPEQDLKFEDIPIGARLIAVADSYDAMTSDRPYRKAYSKEKAIEELRRGTGTQYDPKVVAIFLEILTENDIRT